jgi:poly(3-hydroxybutyrate) depolymerase
MSTFLRVVTATVALLGLLFVHQVDAGERQAGASQFRYVDARWGEARALDVYLYLPKACAVKPASCRVLFSMHGTLREAQKSRDVWVEHADAGQLIIVAPHFDAQRFPSRWYQQGAVAVHTDANDWAYAVIDRLFAELRRRWELPQERYSLYGHSAGGQFVQRMHLAAPHRAEHVLAANAGYYTLAEWRPEKTSFGWPYSVLGMKDAQALVKAALQRPLIVLLGDQDNDPAHHQLNKTRGAMAQGEHRFARGEFFLSAGAAAARTLEVKPNWTKVVVPGVAHDNPAMVKAAARQLEAMAKPR